MKIRNRLAGAAVLLMAAAAIAQNPGARSCSPTKAKFSVRTQKGAELPSSPAAGKALLIFFETGCKRCELPPIRYGANGVWLGATTPDSWFAAEVDPGVLSVCADWQGGFGRQPQEPRVVIFTARPGMSYYFNARTQITNDLVGVGMDEHSELDGNFALFHVETEEALPILRGERHAVFKRVK